MLIIFDLDDTLIDTSGSVTPFKLQKTLKRLIEEGLPIAEFSKAYAELLAINAESSGSKEAICRFFSKHKIKSSFTEVAFRELTAPLPENFIIPTTPHAKEILEFFHVFTPLALVTGGHPPFQLEKLEKARIDPSIFSKIAIPEDSIKKPSYEGLLREFSTAPEEVWVCGDRLEMDLAPAHELGLKTIHLRWGRGAKAKLESWVDHSISDLNQLKEILR